jgi:hypothetical protein
MRKAVTRDAVGRVGQGGDGRGLFFFSFFFFYIPKLDRPTHARGHKDKLSPAARAQDRAGSKPGAGSTEGD